MPDMPESFLCAPLVDDDILMRALSRARARLAVALQWA